MLKILQIAVLIGIVLTVAGALAGPKYSAWFAEWAASKHAADARRQPIEQADSTSINENAARQPAVLPQQASRFGRSSGMGLDNTSLYASPADAQRAGAKRYTSGPCKGYYEGEESWCRPGRQNEQ